MNVQATTLYPFVPSGGHFARSIEFFAALGFEKEWQGGGLARLRFGGACFLLQDIDVPEWQKNQMVVFEVNDLDAYWAELKAKDPASTKVKYKSVDPAAHAEFSAAIRAIPPEKR